MANVNNNSATPSKVLKATLNIGSRVGSGKNGGNLGTITAGCIRQRFKDGAAVWMQWQPVRRTLWVNEKEVRPEAWKKVLKTNLKVGVELHVNWEDAIIYGLDGRVLLEQGAPGDEQLGLALDILGDEDVKGFEIYWYSDTIWADEVETYNSPLTGVRLTQDIYIQSASIQLVGTRCDTRRGEVVSHTELVDVLCKDIDEPQLTGLAAVQDRMSRVEQPHFFVNSSPPDDPISVQDIVDGV